MSRALSLLDDPNGRFALDTMCQHEALKSDVARALVDLIRAQAGRQRRRGLFDQIDAVLADDE